MIPLTSKINQYVVRFWDNNKIVSVYPRAKNKTEAITMAKKITGLKELAIIPYVIN